CANGGIAAAGTDYW
nr:immunoglobulin heavy chain junction region [Macaca mulatta]